MNLGVNLTGQYIDLRPMCDNTNDCVTTARTADRTLDPITEPITYFISSSLGQSHWIKVMGNE